MAITAYVVGIITGLIISDYKSKGLPYYRNPWFWGLTGFMVVQIYIGAFIIYSLEQGVRIYL